MILNSTAKTTSTTMTTNELPCLEARERSLLVDAGDYLIKAGYSMARLPISIQEAQIAEEVLSFEMDKLSLAEQEQAVFDVHGLFQCHNVDPPNVAHYLQQLDKELEEVIVLGNTTNEPTAYERAMYWNKDYVTNPSFRLMFLRCDLFHVKLAAQRMIYHFETKQRLFGKGEILGRDVRFDDLPKAAIVTLERGCFQLLPDRDAAGRYNFFIVPAAHPEELTMEDFHQAAWYTFHTCATDEIAQRLGIVEILYNTGNDVRMKDLETSKNILSIRMAFPKKVTAVHFCCSDQLKPIAMGIQLCLDKETRKRFRLHTGTYDEILFRLQTYGIPITKENHPIRPDHSLALDAQSQWIQERKRLEYMEQTTSLPTNKAKPNSTIQPGPFDVLFGRSPHTRGHSGNLRAYHLVEMHQDEYERAGKSRKTEIAERIIEMIHESKGKFLKWDEGGWKEVSHEAAREKVSHFFRRLRFITTTKFQQAEPQHQPLQQ